MGYEIKGSAFVNTTTDAIGKSLPPKEGGLYAAL